MGANEASGHQTNILGISCVSMAHGVRYLDTGKNLHKKDQHKERRHVCLKPILCLSKEITVSIVEL